MNDKDKRCGNCLFWERHRETDGNCSLPEHPTLGFQRGMYFDGLMTLKPEDKPDISLITLNTHFCAAWMEKK